MGERNKFVKQVLKIDLFGQGVGFSIRGSDTYQTLLGAFLSLLTVTFVFIFAISRLVTLI